jgi:epoxyqueuosine reductase
MPNPPTPRPAIRFTGGSADAEKIRFFGTLMPALMLLKEAPLEIVANAIQSHLTPSATAPNFVAAHADAVARRGDTLIFLHRWQTGSFDPRVFGRARLFLAQLTRLVRQAGYFAVPLDPLSPSINLPRLAGEAGLGNLSPYGLLVHPGFGPRVIISGLRTYYPLPVAPSGVQSGGCTDCLACVRQCPQKPLDSGLIDLRQCMACGLCLAVCPVGKPE